ncbi:transcription termination/antitermination protein NusA [bacterium]|nr:transcription termination/antitermination protein NusA [bacterium]
MLNLKTLKPLIHQISESKGIPEDKVWEAVEFALATAYKKEYGQKQQIIRAKINPETGEVKFWQVKIVVDPAQLLSENEEETSSTPEKKESKTTEENSIKKIKFIPERHILLEEARKQYPDIQPLDEITIPLEVKNSFGRIAAQTAKQVILQKIREVQKQMILSEFKDKEGEIVSGIIQRIDKRNIYVDLGKTLGIMPASEAIPGEHYQLGERKKFYVLKLEEKGSGPVVILSRSHPKFVSKLFEMEVPEIADGVVEIKSIAREPGSRTKIAVISHEENIDPVGSCVGQRGIRVATIIDELNGEKIDIIPYSEEPSKYVAAALGPAQVQNTEIISGRREVRVFVPPDQISLAIGRNGQNVRLAARLTGWKIDVRSSVAPEEQIAGGVADADADTNAGAETNTETRAEEKEEETKKESSLETPASSKEESDTKPQKDPPAPNK